MATVTIDFDTQEEIDAFNSDPNSQEEFDSQVSQVLAFRIDQINQQKILLFSSYLRNPLTKVLMIKALADADKLIHPVPDPGTGAAHDKNGEVIDVGDMVTLDFVIVGVTDNGTFHTVDLDSSGLFPTVSINSVLDNKVTKL